jgi:hypothetical protein
MPVLSKPPSETACHNENQNFGINEMDESEFLQRMQKVYEDKNYDNPEFTK